jgi:glycosyltransferase involved in cell wall biosynthesis
MTAALVSSPHGPDRRRPLRVCHIAYSFYENDNRVIRYAEAVAEQRGDVEVIALRRPSQPRSGESRGVRILRLQQRSVTERTRWGYLLKLLWFLVQATMVVSLRHIRKRYDIVHVHNIPDFLVFAAVVPKMFGARIILDIHDIVPELYAGKFLSADRSLIVRALLLVEQVSCRFADHVIVSNHLWADRLTGRSVPPSKCTTILNYPDLSRFTPKGSKRDDDKFIALYPGTLNHHQGLDIAVRALAMLRERIPTAELHIYGEGPERPGLLRLAQQCGVGDRVIMNDRVALDDISQVMAQADVGVVPKRADGFGNEAFSTKTLEFMACEVPVIVARTRVDAHYFDDSLVRFFAPGDAGALATALLDMYEQRSSRVAQVRAARAFAVRNSWQERVEDYRGLVAALVGRSCGSKQPVIHTRS